MRIVAVCETCIDNAQKDTDPVYKLVREVLSQLDSLGDCDTDLVNLLEKVSVRISIILHKNFAKECLAESKSVKTHQIIKNESDCLDFLCHNNRSKTIINTMLGLSGQKIISDKCELRNLTNKKLKNLCLAYESLMGLTNSKLTTAPSVFRNIRLLKATHSRDLITVCGFPTGGSYKLQQDLATNPLPELNPPSSGDFASADDNIQVKS